MEQRARWWSTLSVNLVLLISSFIMESSWASILLSMVSGFSIIYCGVRLMVNGRSQVETLLAKYPSEDQESLDEIIERRRKS